MEINKIKPVLCTICSESTGKSDRGVLSGSFSGKQYELQLCQTCFLALIGAAKEMRRVNVMFTGEDDYLSENFGVKQQ